jgi:glycosyltransferase involved in cell wall biosynthesis
VTAVAADNRQIRVAALMDTAQVSGPGRQLAALIPALAGAGIEMHVVLFRRIGRPSPAYADFLGAAGIAHTILPERGRFDLALLDRAQDLLDGWAPDIVQTHSYRPTAIAYALRRRGARWRWLGFFHGTTNENLKVRAYHWLDRHLLAAADRIVVMSRPQAERFGGAGQRVRQIHNAVLPAPAGGLLDDALAARIASIPGPRVGVIGRLSHEKGVDLFLDAFGRLTRGGMHAHAVIAGDGPERERLAGQAAALGLAERVHFLGPVYPVEPLYPLLDVVVIPSRSEGLPNVLLEALRADRRVVSTDVGAVSEVLDEPAAGRVVPPLRPDALATAMGAALAESSQAGTAARAAAADRFSLHRRVEAHVSLYRELLGRPATRPAVSDAVLR